jgi:outer membrane protein TolC
MRVLSLWLVVVLSTVILPTVAPAQTPPLTLESAITTALENSTRLKASHGSVDVMAARLQNTRSVLYPKVEARFVYPFIDTESGVSLYQRIWDFKQTQHLVESGRAEIQSSTLDAATQRADIILNTKVAYYTVLAQQALMAAATKTVEESVARVEQAESLAKLGRIPQLEAAKARINLDNAQLQRSTAQNDAAKARLQLATVMGLEGDLPSEPVPRLEYKPVEIDLSAEIHQALAVRPELQSLTAKETARHAEVSAAQQAQYPVIFGRAAYRIKGEGAEQPGFIVGLGVQFTLFEGFASVAKVNEAKAHLLLAKTDVTAMQQQIATEVRQAALNLQLAKDSLPRTTASLRAAEAGRAVVQARYRLGRASVVELAEADALWAATQANYVHALYTYRIVVAQLERALGRPLEE